MEDSSSYALRQLLKRIGLTEQECDVYLSILSLKLARVTNIAKASGKTRSNTYILLRSLEQKGLVSQVERGKVIHFVAESPERLLGLLKSREQEAKELQHLVEGALPLLSSITRPLTGTPRVTILHGLQGIRHIYRDILTQPFLGIYNPQISIDAFGGNIVTQLFGKDVKLRGKDLLVNNAASRQYVEDLPPQEEYEIRILPKDMEFEADVIIFEDEISFFTFSEEATIMRIENSALAQAFRSWHTALWNLSSSIAGRHVQ